MNNHKPLHRSQQARDNHRSVSPIFRYQIWLLAGVFLSLLVLGQFATSQARSLQQTIPHGLQTEVRGPVEPADSYTPTVTAAGFITVAGVKFTVTVETRIDDRLLESPPVIPPGTWARVQAVGEEGSMVATRVKFIKPQRYLRLRDTLETWSDCDEQPFTLLSGVQVWCDESTKLSGKITETQRVDIKATEQLTALKIVGKTSPPAAGGVPVVAQINEITDDSWTVGGRKVKIVPDTEVEDGKGDARVGALVRVLAHEDNEDPPNLIADKIIVLRGAKSDKPENQGKSDEQDEPDELDELNELDEKDEANEQGKPEKEDESEEEDETEEESSENEGKSNKPEKPDKPEKPERP